MSDLVSVWKRDQPDYFCAIGEALITWTRVESNLCNTFCLCLNPQNAFPASSAFWAIVSFEGKLGLVHSVAEKITPYYPELAAEWNAIHNRTLTKSKKRNMIAHGSLVSTSIPGKKEMELFLAPYYQKGRTKRFPAPLPKPGQPYDSRPENRMYLEDIKQAAKNFHELAWRIEKFNDELYLRLQEDHRLEDAKVHPPRARGRSTRSQPEK
jgi:hypothetical protein